MCTDNESKIITADHEHEVHEHDHGHTHSHEHCGHSLTHTHADGTVHTHAHTHSHAAASSPEEALALQPQHLSAYNLSIEEGTPLARMQEKGADFDGYMRTLLTMLMASCTRAFEILPIVKNVDILRNILYAGVWTKFEEIYAKRTGACPDDNGSQHQDPA